MYLHREWKESGIPVSHHMGDEQNNVYQFLRYFDKLYDKFTDLEKKEFFRNFIDEIELYSERQSDGRIVKQINFNFPVYYNGNEGNAIRLPDENTVETVVLMYRI